MLRLSDSISGTACREPPVVGLLHFGMLSFTGNMKNIFGLLMDAEEKVMLRGQCGTHHTTTPKDQKRLIFSQMRGH